MICNRFDVVTVPFPFVDRHGIKRRPALAITNNAFNQSGHTILSMITTKRFPGWPGDTEINDFAAAGLQVSCLIRLKLFTLDNRLIFKKIGALSDKDLARFERALHSYV